MTFYQMPVALYFEHASSPLPESIVEFGVEVKGALGFSIARICYSFLLSLIPFVAQGDAMFVSNLMWHSTYPARPLPLLLIHGHINRDTQPTTAKAKTTTLEMPPSGKAPAYGPTSYSPPQYLLASTGLSHDELVSQYQGEHMRLFPHHL